MSDYNYDYDSHRVGEAGPYRLKGLSRGDSLVAGIILGVAGIVGASGLGSGSGSANQSAYLLETIVSFAASFAFLRSALKRSVAGATPAETRDSEFAFAYNLDIFNVGSLQA